MQFSILLFSLAATTTLVSGIGSTSNPLLHVQRDLERRAVPPCPTCPTSDKHWLDTIYVQPRYTRMEPQSDVDSDTWLPLACSRHGYTCIEVEKGIDYRAGGFDGYPLSRWTRPNGSQVFVSKYWQSTIQFTGPGVSFNIYPAHCTVYILAKGDSSLVKIKGNVILSGGGEKCNVNGESDDTSDGIDVGLISFGYKDTVTHDLGNE